MKNVKKGHTRPIVCLDAGHVGKYNRSPVVPAYFESDMVWKLHNYVAEELERYGIQVIKTRTNQYQDMDLIPRGKASKDADLFISYHSNACDTESVDRPVGIYLVDDNCGSIDETSKELALLLAETVQEVMQTNGKAQIYSKLAGGDRDGDGRKNDDYYGVLYGAHQVGTAGLILEHSFHTNTRAAKWLLEEDNLRKLAKAEAAALGNYYGMEAAEPGEPEPIHWYRVRKTWDDEDSQLGAFLDLAHAKLACPAGYSVFDWEGLKVYSKPAKVEPKVDPARDFSKAKAGTYEVRANGGLNLRAGASMDEPILETMPDGSRVRCYGYHTGVWYYVVSASGKIGFCHSDYLVKV